VYYKATTTEAPTRTGRKENKMSDYAKKYILKRVNQIDKLKISTQYKLNKIADIQHAIDAFNAGRITEDELLYLVA